MENKEPTHQPGQTVQPNGQTAATIGTKMTPTTKFFSVTTLVPVTRVVPVVTMDDIAASPEQDISSLGIAAIFGQGTSISNGEGSCQTPLDIDAIQQPHLDDGTIFG